MSAFVNLRSLPIVMQDLPFGCGNENHPKSELQPNGSRQRMSLLTTIISLSSVGTIR